LTLRAELLYQTGDGCLYNQLHRAVVKVSEGTERVVAVPHCSSSLKYSGDQNGREGHTLKAIMQRLMRNGVYFLRKRHEEAR
jgi:hypothetical protein